MATFPSITPTIASSRSTKARVLRADFGDGYTARVTDGINVIKDTWDVEWLVSETDADTITDFLEARAGAENFDWTAPGESSSKKWICEEWTRNYVSSEHTSISAIFEQVFDN